VRKLLWLLGKKILGEDRSLEVGKRALVRKGNISQGKKFYPGKGQRGGRANLPDSGKISLKTEGEVSSGLSGLKKGGTCNHVRKKVGSLR